MASIHFTHGLLPHSYEDKNEFTIIYDLTLACKLLQLIVIVILTYIPQSGEMIGE